MRFIRWCALAILIGAIAGAQAGPGDITGNWIEAQSLRELPAGIQALLGVGLGGHDGIVDQGAPFNRSDVLVDNMPQRRFALGVVNGDTVVVAVERGGIGYRVEVLEFHQAGMVWESARCATRGDVPRRGIELLETLAVPASQAASSCRMVDGHVSVALRPLPPVAPATPPRVRPRPEA
jgi:hypothetical protein